MAVMTDKLTIEEVAAARKCSYRTVRRAIAGGLLVATKEHGRTLISRDALNRWLEHREQHRSTGVAPSHLERAIKAEMQAVSEPR